VPLAAKSHVTAVIQRASRVVKRHPSLLWFIRHASLWPDSNLASLCDGSRREGSHNATGGGFTAQKEVVASRKSPTQTALVEKGPSATNSVF